MGLGLGFRVGIRVRFRIRVRVRIRIRIRIRIRVRVRDSLIHQSISLTFLPQQCNTRAVARPKWRPGSK